MFAFARSLQLRETLGNEGLVELDAALDEVGQHGRRTFWKSPPIGSSVALVSSCRSFEWRWRESLPQSGSKSAHRDSARSVGSRVC